MKSILQFAAWLSLIGGIIAALFSFSTTGQLGSFGIAAGIGYLFSGFLIWSLLLVIVQMADRLERVEDSIHQLRQRPQAPGEKKSYSVIDRLKEASS